MRNSFFVSILLLVLLHTTKAQINTNNPATPSKDWLWGKTTDCTASQGICVTSDKAGNVYVAGYFRCMTMYFDNIPVNNCMFNNEDVFLVKFNPMGKAQWIKNLHGWGSDRPTAIVVDDKQYIYLTGNFDGQNLANDYGISYNSGVSNFFVVKYSQTGYFLWARTAAEYTHVKSLSICTTGSGGVYIAGYYLTHDLLMNVCNLVNPYPTTEEAFVVKINDNSVISWGRSFGGSGNDRITGIAADGQGGIIITGSFDSPSLPFGQDTLTKTGAQSELFTAKLDLLGNPLWAKTSGSTTGSLKGSAVVCDNTGNVLVGGTFNGANVTIESTSLINADPLGFTNDIFYAKYSNNGNLLWAKAIGSDGDDAANSMSYNGNTYLGGFFKGSSILLGLSNFTNTAPGRSDLFYTKCDANGNVIAADTKGTSYDDAINGISVDASDNVYISGYFSYGQLAFGTDTVHNFINDFVNLNYMQVLAAKAGTASVLTTTTTTTTGLNNISSSPSDGFEIYPNPVTKHLYLQSLRSSENNFIVTLTDILGRKYLNSIKLSDYAELDLEALSAGIYYLRLTSGASERTYKIVKE